MTNLVLSGVDYIKIVVTQQFKIQKLEAFISYRPYLFKCFKV